MVELVSRSGWDARAPRGGYTPLARTRGVKVHYTGSRVDPRIVDDHDLCVAAVRKVQGFHMDGNGWMDIGYSMVACPHRKVFAGRGPGHLPAANGSGLNSGHYAVLGLVGNAGLIEPTDGILHAILDAIDYLREKGGAGLEIKGHRDGYSTDCPGDALYSWIKRGAPRPGQPAGPPPWPGRLLRHPSGVAGTPVMVGEDVRQWQTQMRKLGYDGVAADARYGPISRSGCMDLQRTMGLDVDGIVGELTWTATFAAGPAPSA